MLAILFSSVLPIVMALLLGSMAGKVMTAPIKTLAVASIGYLVWGLLMVIGCISMTQDSSMLPGFYSCLIFIALCYASHYFLYRDKD